MRIARPLSALIATLSIAMAAPAFAHPKVLSAEPVEGATVAKVTQITLTFSEPLIAAMSGMDVVMTGMPGMANHAAMKIGGVRVSVGPDGKTLVAALPRPLSAGSYEAGWHVVSTDTHRVAGKLAFSVK
jgi:methionine-rich copper-binding protein CopC